MASAALTLGVVGAGMIMFAGFAASGAATVSTAQTASAADAAALAGALVQEGLAPGVICESAARAAAANNAELISCESTVDTVTVTVRRSFGAFQIERRARAGTTTLVND